MPGDHCVLDMQTTSKKRTQLMTHRCSGRDSERSRHVQPGHSCHLQCHEELQEPAPNLLLCACTYLHTQTLQGKERMTKMEATKTTEEQKPPTKSPTRIEDMYPGRIPLTNSRIALIITRQRRFADAIGDAISFHRSREVSQRASEHPRAHQRSGAPSHTPSLRERKRRRRHRSPRAKSRHP